ncbi:MAG: translation initiation factor IF-2 [Alphaproteobacteria bacterium]|nr:translation initiation factor IF-2 [Alphaproteobacteria bacterium]
MATTDKGDKQPLKLSTPGRLELRKTVESGLVKQSFSHGRSKTVAVEVKKKRTFRQDPGGKMQEVREQLTALGEEVAPPPEPVEDEPRVEAKPARTLTEQERAVRQRAVEAARKAAESAAARAVIEEASPGPVDPTEMRRRTRDEAARAEDEEKARLDAEDASRRVEEEARLKAYEESRRIADDAAGRAAEAERRIAERSAAAPAGAPGAATGDDESNAARVRGRTAIKAPAVRPVPARTRGESRRRAGKLTIAEALDEESGARQRSVAAFRRRQERERQRAQQKLGQGSRKVVRDVQIPDAITVGELANRMAERGSEVIKALMRMGMTATINEALDQETASLIVSEFGHNARLVSDYDIEVGIGGAPNDEEGALLTRAPVVTIMGHVDHGKTSLLDALRQTDVAAHEAGGITQHIGAYQVELPGGQRITFLDTPGHEAFTAMRQRGATVTDIVVLVVAADDGVQPQTVEAINHARAAKVPLIVAINKTDMPGANPQRVRTELLSHEVVVEDMGGDIQCVLVSAIKKTGLEALAEAIVLQAEVLELKANPDREAYGTVIEAKLERGRGPVATVLVQRGTLHVGDIFVTGGEWGRVRALINERGEQVPAAGPSVPVEVLGLNGTPLAGDDFAVVENDARAREVATFRQQQGRDKRVTAAARGTLDDMFKEIAAGGTAELPVVVKADVQGSVEAIAGALSNLGTSEVRVRLLHVGVGGITESDISLAAASRGLIVGFNVRAIPQARDQAKRDAVEIRYYSVIYDVVDDVRALLEGKLKPSIEETVLGRATVREVFNITRVGKVAGCMITEGLVRRGARARLLRDNVVVHEGSVSGLRRFKDDVREVNNGFECGISLENYGDIQQGDIIECYEVREVARQLGR